MLEIARVARLDGSSDFIERNVRSGQRSRGDYVDLRGLGSERECDDARDRLAAVADDDGLSREAGFGDFETVAAGGEIVKVVDAVGVGLESAVGTAAEVLELA